MTTLFRTSPAAMIALGLALIVAAMLRIPHAAGQSGAREAGLPHCPVTEVALDEGYGLTRTEFRPVCR
ncbi:MAG: hypothetical protein JNK46_00290 [Methylobacteriaceae bacterium]|nr:hypothetical protein [Methylobacteriaceae bacterium]